MADHEYLIDTLTGLNNYGVAGTGRTLGIGRINWKTLSLRIYKCVAVDFCSDPCPTNLRNNYQANLLRHIRINDSERIMISPDTDSSTKRVLNPVAGYPIASGSAPAEISTAPSGPCGLPTLPSDKDRKLDAAAAGLTAYAACDANSVLTAGRIP